MKRLIVVLLLSVFPWRPSQEALPFFDTLTDHCIQDTVDYFETIYPIIRINEGAYVNHLRDRGRETYGGIARRYNKNWEGWFTIDSIKNHCQIKRHTRIEQIEPLVKQYYRAIWDQGQFNTISDINVAYYLFDMRIHHSSFDKLLNSALSDIGCEGEYLNTIDSELLLAGLHKRRTRLFYHLVQKDPSQKVFLKGWIRRANKISVDS